MAGFMLIGAQLDMAYWRLSLDYCIQIFNMSIVKDGKPLMETYLNRHPNFQDLQPFGAVCWLRIAPSNGTRHSVLEWDAQRRDLLTFPTWISAT
jgi:hypothetical protein